MELKYTSCWIAPKNNGFEKKLLEKSVYIGMSKFQCRQIVTIYVDV